MQRVPERRRRVGTVESCYSEYFPRTSFHVSFFRPGSILLCFYLYLCFARSIPLGTRTLGRSAARTRFPQTLPLIVVPHRRGGSRLLWCISRRHSVWRRIRRGLGRGPRMCGEAPPNPLAVLPALKWARTPTHFPGGRATALFPRGGPFQRWFYFHAYSLRYTSAWSDLISELLERYFRSSRAIFSPLTLLRLSCRATIVFCVLILIF